ncbi:MAG: tetratricopeptide repeat protein [Candidatus Krumholzibacteriia bacterium]
MNGWKSRAGTCAFLVLLVAIEGGCWGRKFFRMPAETMNTAAKVDSLLVENAALKARIASIERTLREDQEFARGTNAQLKMDLEELKDQLNALQEMLRESLESSPFKPVERRRPARPDTTGTQGAAPSENRRTPLARAPEALRGDTLETAGGSIDRDSLSGIGGASDTAGALSAPAPPPEELYRQIYLDFSRREYQLALEESESFLAEYPDDPLGEEVLFVRGQCLMEQIRYADALKEFSTILQRYPRGKRVPGALLRMAVSYDAMGQKELAAGVVRRLLKEHPNSEEAKAAAERFSAIIAE